MPNWSISALYRRLLPGASLLDDVQPPAAPDRSSQMPQPLRAGDPVGNVADPTFAITDPREGGRLTGASYPGLVARDVATVARRTGVDPHTALAMGLQESTLGRTQASNPLTVSAPHPMVDPDTDPIAYTLGQSPQYRTALEAHTRDVNLNTALTYLKSLQQRLRTSPEERQIQAYNGLGRPRFASTAYGGVAPTELPENFYGKRVQDIRENVVRTNPALQRLVRGGD